MKPKVYSLSRTTLESENTQIEFISLSAQASSSKLHSFTFHHAMKHEREKVYVIEFPQRTKRQLEVYSFSLHHPCTESDILRAAIRERKKKFTVLKQIEQTYVIKFQFSLDFFRFLIVEKRSKERGERKVKYLEALLSLSEKVSS